MLTSSKWSLLRVTLLSALGAQFTACGGEATTTEEGSGGGATGGGPIGGSGSGGEWGETGGTGAGGSIGGSTGVTGGSTGLTGGSTGETGGASGVYPTCTNPLDRGNGFVQCPVEGYTHRSEIVDCEDRRPRPDIIGDPAVCDPALDTCCLSDADCEGELEYCAMGSGLAPGSAFCAVGCLTDAECGAGSICECGSGPLGICAAASCASDDECAGEARCSSWQVDNGCGPRTTFACQTPQDECGGVYDCMDSELNECVDQDGVRVCTVKEFTCAAGRPFLVENVARAAPIEERVDWCAADAGISGICLDGLSTAARDALAQHFLSAAQMEHASIAAFARFSLQLLSLGAPAALLEATHEAIIDETRHARLCFSLASHYAAKDYGPGPLNMESALEGRDIASIVRLTIIEGCVGETSAALQATEAAAATREPVLRAILERIAADEARHAELAWRFVRWALLQHPDLRGTIAAAFAECQPHLATALIQGVDVSTLDERARGTSVEAEVLAHGLLSAGAQADVQKRVFSEVVRPCLRQLLSAAPAALAGARESQPLSV